MRPKPEHFPLFQAFTRLCRIAYRSWHLAASPVLAKIGLVELFRDYAAGNPSPPSPSGIFLIGKLLSYYVRSAGYLLLLLSCRAAFMLSGYRAFIPAGRTVFVDTYLLMANFLKGDDSLGHYFPEIEESIREAGWETVLLPRFYDSRNPWQYFLVFRALKKYHTSVLTEFQLLRWRDYLYLLYHISVYPLLLLRLFKFIPGSREGAFLRFALVHGLDQTSHLGAVRYLMARRLADKLPTQVRCLQWFENQTFERCFNRGLRTAGATMPVYGAQLFVWAPEEMNIHVDAEEDAAHRPDIILVNGPYYRHEGVSRQCKSGPSLRYSRLFETVVEPTSDKKILVLLSYFEEEARLTVELALQAEVPEKLMFKFHPATPLEDLKATLPAESNIVEGDLYDLLPDTALVIGAASGALAEAAAVGIPVVVACREGKIAYSYLPDIGRGILWETASTPEEVRVAKERLEDVFRGKSEKRAAALKQLRTELFTRPSKQAVWEMLDLIEREET